MPAPPRAAGARYPQTRDAVTADHDAAGQADLRRRPPRAGHDHPARGAATAAACCSARRPTRRDDERGRRHADGRAADLSWRPLRRGLRREQEHRVPPGGRRPAPGGRDPGRARDPRDARRLPAPRAARSSSAICASRGRSSAACCRRTCPDVVGLDFAVHYEPAYQIGGDFYDFIWHDPSHLGLAVGDVAGKAISAALYMARLTSELRSRAAIARTPARLLRRVNQEIAQLGDDGMFATLVYCIYDLENRTLVFTNAGHCVPLLRRGDRVFPLQAERAHTPAARRDAGARGRRGPGPAPFGRHADHGVRRHPRGPRRPGERVRAVAAVAPDPDGPRHGRGRDQGDPRRHRQPHPRTRLRATT